MPTIVSLKQRDERARLEAKISELENLLVAVELKDYDGVVDTKPAKSGDGSYVLLYTKCVKPTRQCAKGGKLHGPYWSGTFTPRRTGRRNASTSRRVHRVKSSLAFLYGLLRGGAASRHMRSRKLTSGARISEIGWC